MTHDFASTAVEYLTAGWLPFPLPPSQKTPPPGGVTGRIGTPPSGPDVYEWCEHAPAGSNTGLRMPWDVIGIDIDHYDNKNGVATVLDCFEKWGDLPDTWRSSARPFPSGILFYRVPAGLAFPERLGPAVELIRAVHRYAVTWPSTHPTGNRYRWYAPGSDLEPATRIPLVSELPWLPQAWVDGLTGGRLDTEVASEAVDASEATTWLSEHAEPGACPRVAGTARRIFDSFKTGTGHDSLSQLVTLARLAEHGHRGVADELAAVREAFLGIATAHGRGHDAAGEFSRSWRGAVGKILATPEVHAPEAPCDCAADPEDLIDRTPPPEPGPDGTPLEQPDLPAPLTAEERHQLAVDREVEALTIRDEARRRIAALEAPPLRRLTAREFRDAPRPQALVPQALYRDSLARIYGAPGCGKSFLALDLAMHIALGLPWRGNAVERGRVFYVMAEGQAVNVLRTEAWCEHHNHDFDKLEGWFDAFPDALTLTDTAIGSFVSECERDQPALVILDTKNAMMVGEENSASDFAVMRRALDAIRKACNACVVLIDHTGYEGTRARGTSAATAGMDTEVFVEKNDDKPPLVTATVTRDKAAEADAAWSWRLRMAGDAAILVPAETELDLSTAPRPVEMDWSDDGAIAIPVELYDVETKGAKAIPDLARFMAFQASTRVGDAAGVGVTRAEAVTALKTAGHERTTVARAWSSLIEMGYLEPAEKVTSPTGRHVWTR